MCGKRGKEAQVHRLSGDASSTMDGFSKSSSVVRIRVGNTVTNRKMRVALNRLLYWTFQCHMRQLSIN